GSSSAPPAGCSTKTSTTRRTTTAKPTTGPTRVPGSRPSGRGSSCAGRASWSSIRASWPTPNGCSAPTACDATEGTARRGGALRVVAGGRLPAPRRGAAGAGGAGAAAVGVARRRARAGGALRRRGRRRLLRTAGRVDALLRLRGGRALRAVPLDVVDAGRGGGRMARPARPHRRPRPGLVVGAGGGGPGPGAVRRLPLG